MILNHKAKSNQSYIYEKGVLHVRLQVEKSDEHKIEIVYGDPFDWTYNKQLDTWTWGYTAVEEMVYEYETLLYKNYFYEIKTANSRMKYAFIIDNRYIFGIHGYFDLELYPSERTNIENFFTFPYLNEEDIFQAPEWTENRVWYSIFTDRFCNGDSSINQDNILDWDEKEDHLHKSSYGGDLEGIISKLDYIESLGINGIYFTPLFYGVSPHKYDTIDYMRIDPSFGSNEIFGRLVKEAHKRGIKVVLDAVFNHCSNQHPFFQDAVKNGRKSKYWDCFYFSDLIDETELKELQSGESTLEKMNSFIEKNGYLPYQCFGYEMGMPKMNTSNPIMKEYLFNVAKYWITEYQIDGWRLDVSNEVSHDFWREFRKVIKDVNPNTFIIGENWDNSYAWLQGDQHDSVMNYEIMYPLWRFLGLHHTVIPIDGKEFMLHINELLVSYPKNVLPQLYNVIESHDTARFMNICNFDLELVKLGYLLLFSFPGNPSIFYGGEIGLSGEASPKNRVTMKWDIKDQNLELKEHIVKLIKLRRKYNSFKSVNINWISVSDDAVFFSKDDTFFAINRGEKVHKIKLPNNLQNKSFIDIYNNNTFSIDVELCIDRRSFIVFK